MGCERNESLGRLVLTRKHENNIAATVLSVIVAWMFMMTKSLIVRNSSRKKPNMCVHIFIVSFVHQNMLKGYDLSILNI